MKPNIFLMSHDTLADPFPPPPCDIWWHYPVPPRVSRIIWMAPYQQPQSSHPWTLNTTTTATTTQHTCLKWSFKSLMSSRNRSTSSFSSDNSYDQLNNVSSDLFKKLDSFINKNIFLHQKKRLSFFWSNPWKFTPGRRPSTRGRSAGASKLRPSTQILSKLHFLRHFKSHLLTTF